MLQDRSSLKQAVKVGSSRDGQTNWDGASIEKHTRANRDLHCLCLQSCNEEREMKWPNE